MIRPLGGKGGGIKGRTITKKFFEALKLKTKICSDEGQTTSEGFFLRLHKIYATIKCQVSQRYLFIVLFEANYEEKKKKTPFIEAFSAQLYNNIHVSSLS